MGSEPSLRLVWAQNQPNFRPNRQNAGNFAENPCIPGNYPATAWVFCRFPQFCLRFCPRPALRLRETREFPEWSTKHPLFSLEISGNAKCWGPSVFLFVCRKSICRPNALPTYLSPGRAAKRKKMKKGVPTYCRALLGQTRPTYLPICNLGGASQWEQTPYPGRSRNPVTSGRTK